MSGALLGEEHIWCPNCSSGGPHRNERLLTDGEQCRRCRFAKPAAYEVSARLIRRINEVLARVDPALRDELTRVCVNQLKVP